MDSNGFVHYFILFVIILIAIIAYQNYTSEFLTVRSKEDNREYLVQKADDQQEAADMLAKIRVALVKLQKHIVQNYPQDERAIQLNELFDPDNMVEAEFDSEGTSYTINKGEKVVICLRARDGTNRIEDYNVLLFVAIHEFSHILTDSVGHTGEFWDNFAWVLREAIKSGVWKYQDFSANPVSYCGVRITSLPLSKEEAFKAQNGAPFEPKEE